MDLQEYADVLNTLPERVEAAALDAIIIPAASRMTANIINRNANKGLNTDGSKRTAYSQRPFFASEEQFIKKSAFKPESKEGGQVKLFDIRTKKARNANVTKDFRESRTMYLEKGYFQLREIQGRRTDIVNYEYSGDLLKAFQFAKAGEGLVVIGFIDELSKKKREGLEKKRGVAFAPTVDEIREYNEEVQEGFATLNETIISKVI